MGIAASAGTDYLSGATPVPVANGGTGAATAPLALASLGAITSATGSQILPVGMIAQRDVTPQLGYFRYNNETGQFEGYYGAVSGWGALSSTVAFSAPTGSSLVGFIQSGTGAVARTVQDELREMVNANDFTGVDPSSGTDSFAGLVLAIAATPTGGTLRLNGFYRVSAALTINRSMTILGIDSRTGNLTSGANSKSYVYFNNDTNGFVVDGCVVTFDKVVIGSLVGTSTHYGISTVNVNNSLIVNNSVIQGFGQGAHLMAGYYNKFTNSTITYCDYGLVADGCYNIVAEALTTNLNTTSNGINIELLNSSSMTMLGGSMENFGGTGFGAALYSGSSLTCIGTYIEGDTARANGWNFNLSTGASLSLIGLHVYLTGCARHVSVEGGGATGTRVFSRNTRFVYPTGAQTCDVYALLNTDATADWDISGDYWNTSAGVNVKYLATASTTVTNGVGNFNICYPANHANYGNNLLSIPFGSGLPFPATQNPSSNANTLDDYKEGNYTPTQGGGLTVVGAFSSSGSYTKVGRLVTVQGQVNGATSVAIAAGGVLCAALPYTAAASCIGTATNATVTATSSVYISGTSLLASTAITATTSIYFTITYFTT